MAALVQSFPSPTSTLGMLQPHSPSADAFQAGPQGQQHPRSSPMPRNIYNPSVGSLAAAGYRGHTIVNPVAPYAFTGPPVMPNAANPLRQHPTSPLLRHENRTSSAPAIPLAQQLPTSEPPNPSRPRPTGSSFPYAPLDLSNVVPLSQKSGSKDDHSISSSSSKQTLARPLSAVELNAPPPFSSLGSSSEGAKPLPERYRRNHRRMEKAGLPLANACPPGGSAPPSGSGMATVGHLYHNPLQSSSTPSLTSYPAFRGSHAVHEAGAQPRFASFDDMSLPKPSGSEQAKRYRRKSVSTIEAKDHSSPEVNLQMPFQPKPSATPLTATSERRDASNPPPVQRTPRHVRHDSTESSNSGRSSSRPSSVSIHPPFRGTVLNDFPSPCSPVTDEQSS
jgi:hypothetical protein